MSKEPHRSTLVLLSITALFFATLSILGNWQFARSLGFDKSSSILFGVIGIIFVVVSMIFPIIATQFWRQCQPIAAAMTIAMWVLALTYGMLAFLASSPLTPALSANKIMAFTAIWGLILIMASILPSMIILLIRNSKKLDDHTQSKLNEPHLFQKNAKNHHADPITDFLQARVYRTPGHRISAKDLHDAYCSWCKEQALTPHPIHVFGQTLAVHQIQKVKSQGRMVYCDICLT